MLQDVFSGFKEKNNYIIFDGETYDAYSLLLDIFNKSKKEIIIIDNYIDKKILDILSKTFAINKIEDKLIIYSLINRYKL